MTANASTDAANETSGLWTLVHENDALASSDDRNYTGGLQIHYRAPERCTPDFAKGIARHILGADDSSSVFTTWALGQNIYAPEDKDVAAPLPDQHPYAGWLYGEMGIHSEKEHTLSSFVIDLGIVGPSAKGEQMQKWFHGAIGHGVPDGWDNQLSDEPGLIATWERRWQIRPGMLHGFQSGLMPLAGVSLGNVLTDLHGGLTFRVGEQIEDYWSPVRNRPGNAGVGPSSIRSAPTWVLWASVQGRAQFQNIFLDGNTWKDSLSVDRKTYVMDVELGGAIKLGRTLLAYTYVLRTDEYSGQEGTTRFGSISVTTSF
jgi:hypothetical protein